MEPVVIVIPFPINNRQVRIDGKVYAREINLTKENLFLVYLFLVIGLPLLGLTDLALRLFKSRLVLKSKITGLTAPCR